MAMTACHAEGGSPSGGDSSDGNAGGGADPAAGAAGSGIRWVGRTQPQDPENPAHVRLSWPGVALGVHFFGTELAITASDDTRNFLGKAYHSYWDVVVDDQSPQILTLTYDKTAHVVAQGLAAQEHTIWLRKRTEAQFGFSEIVAVDVGEGGRLLSPPPSRPRQLQVVGSSVETGYGVEAVDCSGLRDDQQNQNKAWPQLVADQLGADLTNLSYSGKGVAVNLDQVNDPVNTMPVLARLAEPMDRTSTWAFSPPPPDVIVIDLGGNDWEGNGRRPLDPNRFVAPYVAFVEELLVHAPDALVYLTINPISYADKRDWLRQSYQAVAADLAAHGHAKVAVFEWEPYNGAAKACDGHPTAALHADMAKLLVARIRQDLS